MHQDAERCILEMLSKIEIGVQALHHRQDKIMAKLDEIITTLNDVTNREAATIAAIQAIAATQSTAASEIANGITGLRAQLAKAIENGITPTQAQLDAADALVAKATATAAQLDAAAASLGSTTQNLTQMGADAANPFPAPANPPNTVGNVVAGSVDPGTVPSSLPPITGSLNATLGGASTGTPTT